MWVHLHPLGLYSSTTDNQSTSSSTAT
uniref:Uncharacterized protein n=1 Tax=Arundo donax TaxID=35708 RepID=A0A0A9A7J7_ARUDO